MDEPVRTDTAYRLMFNSSTGRFSGKVTELFDGIANLRAETFSLAVTGSTIGECLGRSAESTAERALCRKLKEICAELCPKPVWYRTTDIDHHIATRLEKRGATSAGRGLRGLQLGLRFPDLIRFELRMVAAALGTGAVNLGIKFPMVRSAKEIRQVQEISKEMGLDFSLGMGIGVTIETPEMAAQSHNLIGCGVQFATIGCNDLSALALGLDREEPVGGHVDVFADPKVLQLIARASKPFNDAHVDCLLSGIGIPTDCAIACAVQNCTGMAISIMDSNVVARTRRGMEVMAHE